MFSILLKLVSEIILFSLSGIIYNRFSYDYYADLLFGYLHLLDFGKKDISLVNLLS